jgi:hypothetical protein
VASAASTPTNTVNAAAPYPTVTHVAAGGLYAQAQPGDPANSMLYPLHLNPVVQMAPGGQQRDHDQRADRHLVAVQVVRRRDRRDGTGDAAGPAPPWTGWPPMTG